MAFIRGTCCLTSMCKKREELYVVGRQDQILVCRSNIIWKRVGCSISNNSLLSNTNSNSSINNNPSSINNSNSTINSSNHSNSSKRHNRFNSSNNHTNNSSSRCHHRIHIHVISIFSSRFSSSTLGLDRTKTVRLNRQVKGHIKTIIWVSRSVHLDRIMGLCKGGGVILGRTTTGSEARRSSIVRFMADSAQVSSDNSLVSDRCAVSDLTQNFGFPFIAEGGMNPPPPINANASFIPPVTQSSASRTPALLPVEPQNSLPSFYPSYSPAAHPSLPSEIPLQYFPNQMFTSPTTDKSGSAPLNNRFGSILSPPRPVGFAQASFPLLTDMPMPIANSSGITPHLSNFNLTSLFPEIATAMPPDGSSMPMSPLLSLTNTTSSDSNKQSNRPAHNISHILGHDGTSAV
ncbi:basic helix-loop-helix domain-containing protein USF3 [Pimephales promelas]|nr:basic helix-loop-helix domain-containing protein USF3 [Pimephales promelas]